MGVGQTLDHDAAVDHVALTGRRRPRTWRRYTVQWLVIFT